MSLFRRIKPLLLLISIAIVTLVLLRTPIQKALFINAFFSNSWVKDVKYASRIHKKGRLTLNEVTYGKIYASQVDVTYNFDWSRFAWKTSLAISGGKLSLETLNRILNEDFLSEDRDACPISLTVNAICRFQEREFSMVGSVSPTEWRVEMIGHLESGEFSRLAYSHRAEEDAIDCEKWSWNQFPLSWRGWTFDSGECNGHFVWKSGTAPESQTNLVMDLKHLHLHRDSSDLHLKLNRGKLLPNRFEGEFSLIKAGEQWDFTHLNWQQVELASGNSEFKLIGEGDQGHLKLRGICQRGRFLSGEFEAGKSLCQWTETEFRCQDLPSRWGRCLLALSPNVNRDDHWVWRRGLVSCTARWNTGWVVETLRGEDLEVSSREPGWSFRCVHCEWDKNHHLNVEGYLEMKHLPKWRFYVQNSSNGKEISLQSRFGESAVPVELMIVEREDGWAASGVINGAHLNEIFPRVPWNPELSQRTIPVEIKTKREGEGWRVRGSLCNSKTSQSRCTGILDLLAVLNTESILPQFIPKTVGIKIEECPVKDLFQVVDDPEGKLSLTASYSSEKSIWEGRWKCSPIEQQFDQILIGHRQLQGQFIWRGNGMPLEWQADLAEAFCQFDCGIRGYFGGELHGEGYRIHLKEGSFHFPGVFLDGQLDLFWDHSQKSAVVDLVLKGVDASVAAMRPIFSSYRQLNVLSKYISKGEVRLVESCPLRWIITPNGVTYGGHIALALQGGRGSVGQWSLDQLAGTISFDSLRGSLELQNWKGLIGLPRESGNVRILRGDITLPFTSYADSGNWAIELGLLDEVYTLCGECAFSEGKGCQIEVDVTKSQLPGVQLRHASGLWNHVALPSEAILDADIDLERVPLPINRLLIPGNGKRQGKIEIGLDLSQDGYWRFLVATNRLALGRLNLGQVRGKGIVKSDLWSIESLTWKGWELSAEVSVQPEIWDVRYLGLHQGSHFLVGIDGLFYPKRSTFAGKLRRIDLELEQIDLPKSLSAFTPRGRVFGEGDFVAKLTNKFSLCSLQGEGMISWKGVTCGDLQLEDVEKLNIRVTPSEEILVENVPIVLSKSSSGDLIASALLGRVVCTPTLSRMKIVDGQFGLSPHSTEWLGKRSIAQVSFSEKGPTGRFSWEYSLGISRFGCDFNEGNWTIQGYPLFVSNLSLQSLNGQPSLKGNVAGGLGQWEVKASSPSLSCQTGVLELKALEGASGDLDWLELSWDMSEEGAIFLKSLEGECFGLYPKFTASPVGFEGINRIQRLKGKCGLDFSRFHKWLPTGIQHIVSQFGKGYVLQGSLDLDGTNWQLSTFDGELKGALCEIGGCLIDQMHAKVHLEKGMCAINGWTINDSAGRLAIPKLSLIQYPRGWFLAMEQCSLHDFSLESLRPISENQKRRMNLSISQAVLEEITGFIHEPSTLSGRGEVNFNYSYEKKEQQGFWSYSKGLLKSLGLDFEGLYPAMGRVEFLLNHGKITLKKLHDVYSEGKATRFLLVSGQPSSMDLKGKLDLHFRLKQHKLLLKLTDKMILNVTGDFKHPQISLDE